MTTQETLFNTSTMANLRPTSIFAFQKTNHELDQFGYVWHAALSSYCRYRYGHNNSAGSSSNQILEHSVQWNQFESTPAHEERTVEFIFFFVLLRYIFPGKENS